MGPFALGNFFSVPYFLRVRGKLVLHNVSYEIPHWAPFWCRVFWAPHMIYYGAFRTRKLFDAAYFLRVRGKRTHKKYALDYLIFHTRRPKDARHQKGAQFAGNHPSFYQKSGPLTDCHAL